MGGHKSIPFYEQTYPGILDRKKIKHIFKFLDLDYLFVNQSNFKQNHILKKVKNSLTIKLKEIWVASL